MPVPSGSCQAGALVHEGLGVALVNQLCVDEELWSGLVVRPVDLELPVAVYLINSAFEPLRPECQASVQLLVEQQLDMAAPVQMQKTGGGA